MERTLFSALILLNMFLCGGCFGLDDIIMSSYTPKAEISNVAESRIPLYVAVLIDQHFKNLIYSGVDSNHGDDPYIFTLKIGESTSNLLRDGLPLVFQQVVFVDSVYDAKDYMTILIPEVTNVSTKHGKIVKNSSCCYKKYEIEAEISLKVVFKNKMNETVFEVMGNDKQYDIKEWHTYCSNGKHVSGANGRNYGKLMAKAESNTFSNIVDQLKESGELQAYIEELCSLGLIVPVK